jgi:hypothetical protein
VLKGAETVMVAASLSVTGAAVLRHLFMLYWLGMDGETQISNQQIRVE